MYRCINMCVGNRTDWHRHSPDSKNTVQIYKGDRVIYVKPVRGSEKVLLIRNADIIPLTIKNSIFIKNFKLVEWLTIKNKNVIEF